MFTLDQLPYTRIWNMRICKHCSLGNVEDEFHFILICPFYERIREKHIIKEMVRAVLTERQTSDCDVKCSITFITKENYCRRMWNSKHLVGPNFYQYDQWKVNDRLFRKHEILVPLSIMGVWKKNQKFIVDECASHGTLFLQALSIELAALAITKATHLTETRLIFLKTRSEIRFHKCILVV